MGKRKLTITTIRRGPVVRCEFNVPLAWFSVSPKVARQLANKLVRCANMRPKEKVKP